MNQVLLDPTSEWAPSQRERLARPAKLDGLTVGLLDISKPRGDVFLDQLETQLRGRNIEVLRFAQADVHEARTDRSPSRDLDEVRPRDRSTRRLRVVHVVQCARHR